MKEPDQGIRKYHSPESERGLIGMLAADEEKIVTFISWGLNPDCFYDRQCNLVASAAWSMFSRGLRIDMITLNDALREEGEAGMLDFIMQCVDIYPSPVYARQYADKVLDHHRRSLIIDAAAASVKAACEAETAEIASAQSVEAAQAASVHKVQRKSNQEVAKAIFDKWKLLGQADQDPVSGLRSPWGVVDALTSGYSNAMHVLAGRPGAGKTTFANEIAIKTASDAFLRNGGQPGRGGVLIFALDIDRHRWIQRTISRLSGVSLAKLNQGYLCNPTGNDAEKVSGAVDRLAALPMYIYDDVRTLPEIAQSYRYHKIRYGIELVIIDYIQKIRVPSIRGDNMHGVMTECCNTIMALNAELELPSIILSQLSRSGEREGNHVPRLSDLRESGSIEESATTVTLLSKPVPFPYNEVGIDERKRRPILVDVAKNQDGTPGRVFMWFDCPYFKFTEAPFQWGCTDEQLSPQKARGPR